MFNQAEIGLHGKLPGYGDFLTRNLPPSFIEVWDQWLQFYISVSRDHLGDAWIDCYLTSPIWRFVLSAGVIDEKIWCGVVMPSVDRVGRCFPFSLLSAPQGAQSACDVLLNHQTWFEQLEQFSLAALDEQIDLEQLIRSSNELPLDLNAYCKSTPDLGSPGSFVLALNEKEVSPLSTAVSHSLDASLASSGSYSFWQTSGSEVVVPSFFSCQGLPPVGGLSAMMDGQWQQHQWKIPFTLEL